MKKSFLIFMFCASSALILSSGYDSDRDSQSSVFSNHGWHDSESSLDSEVSESTQVLPSAGSIPSQDLVSPVPLVSPVSPVEFVWDPSGTYSYKADGWVDRAVADRIHASWLAHLDDESLQKKCTLIQKKGDAEYISSEDREFLGEFARRHPEGLGRALAGSKRGRDFSYAEVDTLCEGVEGVLKGLFEKFKTKDVDTCLACLDARNEEIQRYLLITLAPKADFKRVVVEQVEIDRMRKMLCYKKHVDSGQDDEVFVDADARQGLQQKNLITRHFPRSLVPYPVWPVASSDSSEKPVKLK
jgi:hypothetical protein